MEVHKHPHHVTHRKKWGEYFLEFLMIFLAVFLGFIAENQREHIVDRKKEKEFMRSLLSELKTDVRRNSATIVLKVLRLRQSDSLMNLLVGSSAVDSGNSIYYFAWCVSRRISIYMRGASFQQLKSAGGLRLVSPQLADSIESYYSATDRLQQQQEFEEGFIRDYRDLLGDLFDVKIFLSMSDHPGDDYDFHRPPDNPKLLTYDRNFINKFCMRLRLLQRQSSFAYQIMTQAEQRGENLIRMIQNEYHLQ